MLQLTLAAALAVVSSQEPSAYEKQGYPLFGHVVSSVGDVDGDGTPDILIADPGDAGILLTLKARETGYRGRVWVVSGRDGGTIHGVSGDEADDGFGASISAAGDVDADGRPDWIVGAPDRRAEKRGSAVVYSGRTGAAIHRLRGEIAGACFGSSVARAGDVDADGHADVIVAALGANGSEGRTGATYVLSGRDGTLLQHLEGGAVCERGAGDVDGDGGDDVVVLRAKLDGKERIQEAEIYSGRSGRSLMLIQRNSSTSMLNPSFLGGIDIDADGRTELAFALGGRLEFISSSTGMAVEVLDLDTTGRDAFASLGDVDGDGTDDILTADHTFEINNGRVEIVSGRNGSILYSIHGGTLAASEEPADWIWHFGEVADAVGDLDGDRVCDFVVGADFSKTRHHGRAWAFTGRGGLLWTFRREGDGLVAER